jgi:small subunit ribosomal protein S8
MSMSDPIADCLTRIRNAQRAKLLNVRVLKSKVNAEITKILKGEGYIQSFQPIEEEGRNYIEIELKYTASRAPVIREIKRVSTPGCRRYSSVEELKKAGRSMETMILSTAKGIMTDRKAKKENVGGEVICRVS